MLYLKTRKFKPYYILNFLYIKQTICDTRVFIIYKIVNVYFIIPKQKPCFQENEDNNGNFGKYN